jgi:antitoxin HicB
MLCYPAKIVHNRKDKAYLVSFPDFPNVNTFGDTLEEAIYYAHEALSLSVEVDFERGFDMPKPSKIQGKNIYQIRLPLHVEIPLRLRELRGNQSQKEVAKKLKISAQAYQKFEHPTKCNLTLKTLEQLEKVFDCQFNFSV